MTTARPADRIAELERRVAALEAAIAPPAEGESEDGVPRKWLRLAEAAAVSGRSVSGLRKLQRQKRLRVRYRGPHPIVDVTSIPARRAG
jgi:hypothetical protein